MWPVIGELISGRPYFTRNRINVTVWTFYRSYHVPPTCTCTREGRPQATLKLRPNINGVMDGYNDCNCNKLKAKLLDRNTFATLLTGLH